MLMWAWLPRTPSLNQETNDAYLPFKEPQIIPRHFWIPQDICQKLNTNSVEIRFIAQIFYFVVFFKLRLTKPLRQEITQNLTMFSEPESGQRKIRIEI